MPRPAELTFDCLNTIALILMEIFLWLAACTALLSAFTFLVPGTIADRIWDLKPMQFAMLNTYPSLVGIGFLALASLMMSAAIGWHWRRTWGWSLTIVIFVLQVVGDGVQMVIGNSSGGLLGVSIALVILVYLFRPIIRTSFVSRSTD